MSSIKRALESSFERPRLYFLLGLPTAVLLEVATSFRTSLAESAKERYRSVAEELLLYLKRCKNLFTASTAYSTACAAAMLGDQESMDRLRTVTVRCRQIVLFEETDVGASTERWKL